MKEYMSLDTKILLLALVSAVLSIGICAVVLSTDKPYKDCKEKGGEMVKTIGGFKCVKLEKL